MSYYKDKRIVANEINNKIENKKNFSISRLQIELGKRYEVGDKFIENLIYKHAITNKNFLIVGDEVQF